MMELLLPDLDLSVWLRVETYGEAAEECPHLTEWDDIIRSCDGAPFGAAAARKLSLSKIRGS